MAGDDLLVAPLFNGEHERVVRFPAGTWYDFETGERVSDGETRTIRRELPSMPLFVRAGAIVPLMPPLPHVPRPGDTVAIEARHYGAVPGHFRLYDDDGESLAYRQGRSRWIDFRVEIGPDGSRRGRVEAGAPVGGLDYSPVEWRWLG
jgi:alpha-D-xyloside xylohydrolase